MTDRNLVTRESGLTRIGFLLGVAAAVAVAGLVVHQRLDAPPPPTLDYAALTEGLISLSLSQVQRDRFRLSVENRSTVPVAYLGYDRKAPVYGFEVRRGESWSRVPMGWCGNGRGLYTLPPGGTLSLEIPGAVPRLAVEDEFRVCMRFVSAPANPWQRQQVLRDVRSE